jgi:hypothetical protein
MSARTKSKVAGEVTRFTIWGNDTQSALKIIYVITGICNPKANGHSSQQRQRKIRTRYLFQNVKQAQPVGLLVNAQLF